MVFDSLSAPVLFFVSAGFAFASAGFDAAFGLSLAELVLFFASDGFDFASTLLYLQVLPLVFHFGLAASVLFFVSAGFDFASGFVSAGFDAVLSGLSLAAGTDDLLCIYSFFVSAGFAFTSGFASSEFITSRICTLFCT